MDFNSSDLPCFQEFITCCHLEFGNVLFRYITGRDKFSITVAGNLQNINKKIIEIKSQSTTDATVTIQFVVIKY